MLDNPKKMWRKPSPSATCCIFEPGFGDCNEAIAGFFRRRPPLFIRSKKYCLKIFGSSVQPDLLETMQIVQFERSTLLLERLDLCRVGEGIEDVHLRVAFAMTEGQCGHDLGTEARSAHPEQGSADSKPSFSTSSPGRPSGVGCGPADHR